MCRWPMALQIGAGVLAFLVAVAPVVSQDASPVPEDREIVRIALEQVPPELQDRVDPCAVERGIDGLYAVLFLSEPEADGLVAPHERLGRLSDHLRRFLPVNTLGHVDIPSVTRLLDLPPGGGGTPRDGETTLSYDRYHSPQEGVAFMQDLAAAFPDFVQMVDIGDTNEGRDIWALKITDGVMLPPEPDEERILFTGVTHAREWATHEMMLYMAEYLTSRYGQDPLVTHLVDNSVIWLVPVVNPDGFEYSWSDYRMWRKNRASLGGSTCVGVDINRNYAYGWGGSGSSGDPCSSTYRGPEPASEPETQAIQSLLASEKPVIALSYHTYSQLLLYAWGWTEMVTPESYSSARAIGRKYADLVEHVHGQSYIPGQGSYAIYVTSGAFDDHAYGAEGVLGFTPELRPASWSLGGFALPEDEILPNNEENMAAALWLMLNVADAHDLSNPLSGTLFESTGLGDHMFSLPLAPVNQKPSAALGLPEVFHDNLRTWQDDALHAPPAWGMLTEITWNEGFEGCGSGSGYVFKNTEETSEWVAGLVSYKALPHVFEDGADVMLSNVESGFNLIGIPNEEAVSMEDISIFARVLEPSGHSWGYREVILEERTALEDMAAASPWINWNWLYTDSTGMPHYANPTGVGAEDTVVYPFRAYHVYANVPSWDFGFNVSEPVYLLHFPGDAADCNANGISDIDELVIGLSLDCDGDWMPDDCEYPLCDGLTAGDMDCSGVVDAGDIPTFVQWLLKDRYTCQNDVNLDGLIDGRDMEGFVELLIGG